jgi:hypothetical protein
MTKVEDRIYEKARRVQIEGGVVQCRKVKGGYGGKGYIGRMWWGSY